MCRDYRLRCCCLRTVILMDCSIEVKRIHLLHQDGRLRVVSSVTAPASLSNQESGPSTFTTIKGAKEPQTFSGNALEFKEWVFAMDLVVRSLAIDDPQKRVDYAAGFCHVTLDFG